MTADFQALLARLLIEPGLMAELHEDPRGFAEAYRADEADVQRLRRLDHQHFAVAALTVSRKRAERGRRTFPATFALLERLEDEYTVLVRMVDDAHVRRAANSAALEASLIDLGARLQADSSHPLLHDVLTFELLCLDVVRHAKHPRQPGQWRAEQPCLRAGVAAATFGCAVVRARQQVLSDTPTDVTCEPTHYVLNATGEGELTIFEVTETSYDILHRCNGQTSVTQIAHAAGVSVADVDTVLEQAAGEGLIATRPS